MKSDGIFFDSGNTSAEVSAGGASRAATALQWLGHEVDGTRVSELLSETKSLYRECACENVSIQSLQSDLGEHFLGDSINRIRVRRCDMGERYEVVLAAIDLPLIDLGEERVVALEDGDLRSRKRQLDERSDSGVQRTHIITPPVQHPDPCVAAMTIGSYRIEAECCRAYHALVAKPTDPLCPNR